MTSEREGARGVKPVVTRQRTRLFVQALILGILAFAAPLLIADHYGAVGIPRGDDWSYLVTLFRFVDSGELSFNHWVSMNLIGQLVLAAPLAAVTGNDIGSFQVMTAGLGVFGLGAVAVATAMLIPARWAAALLAVTIAAGPLWGPLAVSFMTDIPAFAFSAASMLLALVAFRARPVSIPWLGSSVLVGLGAFTIRQYAIVVVAAALLTGVGWFITNAQPKAARRVIVVGIAVVVAAIVFNAWWQTIPDGRALAPELPDAHSVRVTIVKGVGFVRLAGLLLLPVVMFAGPFSLLRRGWRASRYLSGSIGAATIAILTATASRVPGDVFVGNYVMRDGALSDIVLIGPRPDVFPVGVWNALVLAGNATAVVLMVALVPFILALVRRARARDFQMRDPIGSYLGLTTIGYAAAYGAAMASGLQVYDRYLLPALPAIGLLLLRQRPLVPSTQLAKTRLDSTRTRAATTIVALTALVMTGLAFTADSASFDGARWKAAVAATELGWDPQQVNGGFEWLNYHRRDKFDPTRPPPDGAIPICVTVHVNPEAVKTEIVAVVKSRAPTRSTARLVAFRTTHPCRTVRPESR